MINLFKENNFVKVIKRFTLFTVVVSFLASCVSTKNITYFQGDDLVDTVRYLTLKTITPPIVKIQTNDILAVSVSSLSAESNEVFNFPNVTPIPTSNFPGSVNNGSRAQPLGYIVDSIGHVDIPLIGKVFLKGMTLDKASTIIKSELIKYLKEPTVTVRFLNHKFTIIGEVARPGVYNLVNSYTSLPEAIGIAGDLNVYGRRDNVMIIREFDGERSIAKIDLTGRKILDSKYYSIRNNDVIYVEPTKGKVTSSDRALQLIPTITGVTTTLVLLINLFK